MRYFASVFIRLVLIFVHNILRTGLDYLTKHIVFVNVIDELRNPFRSSKGNNECMSSFLDHSAKVEV